MTERHSLANYHGMLTADALRAEYGNWAEIAEYPLAEWLGEVAARNTREGYWDWVEMQIEQAEAEFDGMGNPTDGGPING